MFRALKPNIMNGTCTKCGASIKYIVTIGGVSYGTKCAETILGHGLPKNYSGSIEDYQAWKKKQKEIDERRNAEMVAKHKELQKKRKKWFKKYTDDVKKLHLAFCRASNDWECDFVCSIANQIDLPVLGSMREWEMKYFQYQQYEPRGLAALSEKQMAIFNRILNEQ